MTELEALTYPGEIYRHFKGGIYRLCLNTVNKEDALYVHLWPHAVKLYSRPKKEFHEIVDKPEYKYFGPRFKLVAKSRIL